MGEKLRNPKKSGGSEGPSVGFGEKECEAERRSYGPNRRDSGQPSSPQAPPALGQPRQPGLAGPTELPDGAAECALNTLTFWMMSVEEQEGQAAFVSRPAR